MFKKYQKHKNGVGDATVVKKLCMQELQQTLTNGFAKDLYAKFVSTLAVPHR